MRLFRRPSGLSVRVVPDGTITPVTPFPTTRHRHSVKLGVFDRDDRLVRESLLFRSYGQIGFKATLGPEPGRDRRSVIFAGPRTNAFGHFLLEGLSRLWYAKEHPDLPIVWACRSGTQSDLLPWQRDILRVVGLRNDVILLREETRFRAVHVPEPGYRIKDWFSQQQADFLARYPARVRDPALKLWLSRSGLPFEDRSLHAERLERSLAEQGWTVFRPERHAIEEQLSKLATASRVAGEQGSAFHLVVLLADVRGLELDIICRDPRLSTEEQNQNYQTIADMRGLVQRLHVIPEERVLNVKGPHIRKLASTLAGHLEALGITRDPEAPPARPRPVATFAGAVARSIGARTYLEVGRDGWGAWPDLELETRHVVRSAFPIDPRTATADGLHLYEMPQDDFFAWCTDPETRYDLILIDELGGVGDAAGCVAASLPHATPDAAWIVLGAVGDALIAATGAALDSAPAPAASDARPVAELRWASGRLEGRPVTVLTRGGDPSRLLAALQDEAG